VMTFKPSPRLIDAVNGVKTDDHLESDV
jgi:hypothetical protein